ncbi:MAG TPA: M56 family metallopeptidase [Terriglobales bacterium]|nr:M56 family metallopeptidase [Terriglobales bacterium]
MYLALGASLALACFLPLNACFSLFARFLFHLGMKTTPRAQTGATFLFLLKIFPACISALCILFLVIPSYLILEPGATTERISWVLLSLVALSALLFTCALLRGLASWRRSRLILRDWLRRSHPVSLPGVNIPAYKLKESFPVIAVIGALHPRLFVSEQVFDALNAEEFTAAIQHEIGHLAARDNLKRWFAGMCPTVLFFLPGAENLSRTWHAASEESADCYAVQQGRVPPLNLASALIKVSRMMPDCNPVAVPTGAYFLEHDDLPDVARRVHALLDAADSSSPIAGPQSAARRRQLLFCGLLASSIFVLIASYPTLLLGVHEVLERFLRLVS